MNGRRKGQFYRGLKSREVLFCRREEGYWFSSSNEEEPLLVGYEQALSEAMSEGVKSSRRSKVSE